MKKYKDFLIIAAIVAGLCMIPAAREIQRWKTYSQAVSLVFDGSYEEAEAIFRTLSNKKKYRECYKYIDFCNILRYHEEGNITRAYFGLYNLHLTGLTAAQEKKLEDLRAVLEPEYEAYREERRRIEEGIPFVGMSEGDVGCTSLGSPADDVHYDLEYHDGKACLVKVYEFEQNGETIFKVRCEEGTVTEVWDLRKTSTKPAVPPPYTGRKDSAPEQNDDPYNVNDYYSEEDFYEDHYDDFFDFEDAEDYFYEHHS